MFLPKPSPKALSLFFFLPLCLLPATSQTCRCWACQTQTPECPWSEVSGNFFFFPSSALDRFVALCVGFCHNSCHFPQKVDPKHFLHEASIQDNHRATTGVGNCWEVLFRVGTGTWNNLPVVEVRGRKPEPVLKPLSRFCFCSRRFKFLSTVGPPENFPTGIEKDCSHRITGL